MPCLSLHTKTKFNIQNISEIVQKNCLSIWVVAVSNAVSFLYQFELGSKKTGKQILYDNFLYEKVGCKIVPSTNMTSHSWPERNSSERLCRHPQIYLKWP